jgi:hypothetical protein
MPRFIRDVCPHCQTDISRRLGLITTAAVECPKCGLPMRVTSRALVSNWQYNFAASAGAGIFFAVVIAVLASPQVAEEFGKLCQLPSRSLQDRLILSLCASVPLLLAVIPIGLVGRLVGYGVARRLVTDEAAEPSLTARVQNLLDPDPMTRN